MNRRITALHLFAVIAIVGVAIAQQQLVAAQTAAPRASDVPQVENARLETRALSGSLASAVSDLARQSGPAAMWVGYVVERAAGQKFACCGSFSDETYRCGTCRLERDRGSNSESRRDDPAGPGRVVPLESNGQLAVLLRLEATEVQQVRVASDNCTLDAGGLRFVWLTGVRGEQSVALLKSYVAKTDFAEGGPRHLGNEALSAIALHGDVSADAAMQEFSSPQSPEKLRKQTAFWLGTARGARGLALLEKMAKNDPSGEVRSQVAFGLYVSKEPSAVDDMIRMAREDESTHVRGQALFWLGQKAGQKALNAISGTIENDPDTEIKKKAVFALSQLPDGEGLQKLMEVAENNPNREVRKQAMFWLGQSHDPRALVFFERILRQ